MVIKQILIECAYDMYNFNTTWNLIMIWSGCPSSLVRNVSSSQSCRQMFLLLCENPENL